VKKYVVMLLLLLSPVLAAEELFMVRSQLSFPEAMTVLQQTIQENGYQVSRVQRIDIGLTRSGYKTDKYRVVFFGNLQEVRKITDQYPEMVAYLPLKIAIFAENDETILLSSSFKHLRPFYSNADLLASFARWETDIQTILERVRTAE
jgi:uncharacterized protein (DUF302 family)